MIRIKLTAGGRYTVCRGFVALVSDFTREQAEDRAAASGMRLTWGALCAFPRPRAR